MKKQFISYIILFIIIINTILLGFVIKDNKSIFEVNKRIPTALVKNVYFSSTVPNTFNFTDNFIAENLEDLKDIYFTVLSSGMDEFTFYCSEEYDKCVDDLGEITKTDILLSIINNFVHIYNSFERVSTNYNNKGEITIKIEKLYSKEMITEIENKLDEIYPTIIKENNSLKDNIKNAHNYIINNTKYDLEYLNDNSLVPSKTAYGPLFYNLGICSGYSDLMSLFLHRLGVPNYRISNEKHMWNYLLLDDKWYHLDVTWDDPITSDNRNLLTYDYFLLTTDQLIKKDQKLDVDDHNFDINIYEKE